MEWHSSKWWAHFACCIKHDNVYYLYLDQFYYRRYLVWNSKTGSVTKHDDVIKWKHFPRNWPFVREIHRSPVNFPHKGQWRGALMFSLIYAWINDWVNNREAGDLRRQHGHYDVIGMRVFLVISWDNFTSISFNPTWIMDPCYRVTIAIAKTPKNVLLKQ